MSLFAVKDVCMDCCVCFSRSSFWSFKWATTTALQNTFTALIKKKKKVCQLNKMLNKKTHIFLKNLKNSVECFLFFILFIFLMQPLHKYFRTNKSSSMSFFNLKKFFFFVGGGLVPFLSDRWLYLLNCSPCNLEMLFRALSKA